MQGMACSELKKNIIFLGHTVFDEWAMKALNIGIGQFWEEIICDSLKGLSTKECLLNIFFNPDANVSFYA